MIPTLLQIPRDANAFLRLATLDAGTPLPACLGRHGSAFSGMDFSNYLRMDPHLLVGLVNTELRNHSESLDDLVKTHGISEEDLVKKLANAGYDYRADQKQFR